MKIKKILVAAVSMLCLTATAYAAPKVMVSIAPLHSLASGVMEGVGTPELLVRGASSPHDYALRPSEARKLAEADVVFWVGPVLEGFMEKTLRTNEAASAPLIGEMAVRLAPREGGVWEGHAHHDHDGHHHHADIDPHVWLDPRNAQAMVSGMEKTLIRVDPDNAEKYRQNAARVRSELAELDEALKQTLKNDSAAAFIVFHDAFQYFEKRYGLNGAGAITVNPEQKPSAKRLVELRERIRSSGVRCVFAEPQFNDGLVRSIIEGSDARRATLDPLGSSEPSDRNAYFSMMRTLAGEMHRCLSDQP